MANRQLVTAKEYVSRFSRKMIVTDSEVRCRWVVRGSTCSARCQPHGIVGLFLVQWLQARCKTSSASVRVGSSNIDYGCVGAHNNNSVMYVYINIHHNSSRYAVPGWKTSKSSARVESDGFTDTEVQSHSLFRAAGVISRGNTTLYSMKRSPLSTLLKTGIPSPLTT